MSPQVWQIACGEKGRRYQRLFLDHDVMFVGPGRFGPYAPEQYEENPEARAEGEGKITYIRQFATEVRPGDLVLLRSGYNVLSIGTVESDYFHTTAFDDVYGWDLEHCRRVIWQRQHDNALQSIQAKSDLFAGRTKMPSFSRVHEPKNLNPVRDLLSQITLRESNDLPQPPPPPLTPEELSDALFREGLGYDACLHVERAVRKLRGLLNWYNQERSPGRSTEHEVVAHLILPLMLALGWSEQLLALEWNRIDRRHGVYALYNNVRRDGQIRHNGVLYKSPSKAATAISGVSSNGWTFWSYERAPGQWMQLMELKKR